MATFANQISNLSALTSALGTFSRILELTEDDDSFQEVDQNQQDAEAFLESQKERLGRLEQQLFHATEHILPADPESMSVTELAELCHWVQESNRRQLQQLKHLLEATGCDAIPWEWEEQAGEEPLTSPHPSLPYTLLGLGRPLERVLEGDAETDGGTSVTPGSMGYQSPFFASTKKKRVATTPTTPTMDSFSFSTSTNSILQNQTLEKESPAGTTSRELDYRPHLNAFREEDDMITLDSRSTVAAAPKRTNTSLQDERNNFFARMESMLEHVEESILESRPSDEIDERRKTYDARKSFDTRSMDEFSLNRLRSHGAEDDGEEETISDDSTNVAATVVANDRMGSRNEFMRPPEPVPFHHRLEESHAVHVTRPVACMQRPTHIMVDSAVASPAHTNLTMDATMMNMNDTMASFNIAGDDDNSSTMTPILDRYRLDPDDNSIGVKVVPNQRGSHRASSQNYWKSEQRTTPLPTVYSIEKQERELSTPLPTVYSNRKQDLSTPFSSRRHEISTPMSSRRHEISTPMSLPAGLPGSVSARKKYRKTPHPKKNLGRELDEDSTPDEENRHPNQVRFPSRDAKTPLPSITVPPLRSRSFEPRKNALHKKSSASSRAASLSVGTGRSQTPLTDAFAEKHLWTSSDSKADMPSGSHSGKWIENISMAEYEGAPRVVSMQVTRDEVNAAASALEGYFFKAPDFETNEALELTEKQAYQVVGGESERKARSILMSLCHWRRLLMYRDPQQGMVFAINQNQN